MSKIKTQVMASVGAIYIARALLSARAIKIYALLISFIGIAMFASLPNVAHNFSIVLGSGLPGVANYILVAVLNTKSVVQLGLVVATVAILSLFVDIARITPRGGGFAA